MRLYKPDLLMLFYNKSLLQTDIKGLIVFYKIQLTMISTKVEINNFRLRPTTFFHKEIIFGVFPSSSKYFSFIKNVSHEKIFFLHETIFSSKKISFIKEIFLHQGSFPQANIFPSFRKFSTSQHFFLIKKIFHRQTFYLHQEYIHQENIFPLSRKFSMIKNVFHEQRLFLDQGNFLQSKNFSNSQDFFVNKSLIYFPY